MIPEPAAPDQRPVVLVVEDEALIRMCTADMLDALGFDVLEAASMNEALAALAEARTIDLVITDMILPGQTGAFLHERIKLLYPALPVLVVSGMPRDDADVPWLAKPYGYDELVASIAALIDLPKGSPERY